MLGQHEQHLLLQKSATQSVSSGLELVIDVLLKLPLSWQHVSPQMAHTTIYDAY